MDFFDRAQELELLQRESSIAAARNIKPDGPTFTGKCHYCVAELVAPRRFCDGECREGWDKLSAASKRRGTVEEPED